MTHFCNFGRFKFSINKIIKTTNFVELPKRFVKERLYSVQARVTCSMTD